MSRIRTRILGAVAAAPLAAALLLGAAGAASADGNGAFAGHGSTATANNTGAGQVSGVGGSVHGNYNNGQQVATGQGASNQNNTLQAGNGPVFAKQTNATWKFVQNF